MGVSNIPNFFQPPVGGPGRCVVIHHIDRLYLADPLCGIIDHVRRRRGTRLGLHLRNIPPLLLDLLCQPPAEFPKYRNDYVIAPFYYVFHRCFDPPVPEDDNTTTSPVVSRVLCSLPLME